MVLALNLPPSGATVSRRRGRPGQMAMPADASLSICILFDIVLRISLVNQHIFRSM